MKKITYLVFIIVFIQSVYSQKTFIIYGTISDCKQNKPIAKMPVKLVCEDGQSKEVLTDVLGKYTINLKPTKLPLICIIFSNSTMSGDHLLGWSSERIKFTLSDSSSIKRKENICEKPTIEKDEETKVPSLIFKKNSFDISKDEEYKISQLITLMKKHPASQYKITGYNVVGDKIDDSLYYKRTNMIKQKIIAAGIDSKRILVLNSPPSLPDNSQMSHVIFFTFLGHYTNPVPKDK